MTTAKTTSPWPRAAASRTCDGSSGMPRRAASTSTPPRVRVTSAPIIAKGRFLTDTGLVTGPISPRRRWARTTSTRSGTGRRACPGSLRREGPRGDRGATTSGIDFALSPGGAIEGRVHGHDTGADLDRASVVVYNLGGSFVTSGRTSMGDYTVGKLCTGTTTPSPAARGEGLRPRALAARPPARLQREPRNPHLRHRGAVTRGIHFKPRLGSPDHRCRHRRGDARRPEG